MKGNEINFKSKELDPKKRCMALEIHQDGARKANSLE